MGSAQGRRGFGEAFFARIGHRTFGCPPNGGGKPLHSVTPPHGPGAGFLSPRRVRVTRTCLGSSSRHTPRVTVPSRPASRPPDPAAVLETEQPAPARRSRL